MAFENFIPFGAENAISRSGLMAVTGESDRQNREKIEAARRAGAIIINEQNGNGYYRVDPENMSERDIAAVSRQYHQNQHRALSILSQQKHLRKALKKYGKEI